MSPNLTIARNYFDSLEQGVATEALSHFFDSEVQQHEYPNALSPRGARRDLAALLEGHERGKRFLREQRYEILSAVEHEDRLALEVKWMGELAVPLGDREAGSRLTANFAIFLEFKNSKIVRQSNYDCFHQA